MHRKLIGAAALAGGALWIVFAALAAGLPEGCVGDEGLLRTHRDTGELELLFLAGGALILLSFAAIARGLPLFAVAGGVALILVGTTSEDPWTPLVVPGILACVAGFALAQRQGVQQMGGRQQCRHAQRQHQHCRDDGGPGDAAEAPHGPEDQGAQLLVIGHEHQEADAGRRERDLHA